ncbi:hypothetical protein COCON_G00209650 [Conger conger]|uniref:Uncharacterized protein n=1 Tax=Conger conger TaxID=82655 RepID=A0A9Q1D0G7_CONCO|nr:hypothetical protein COCON_G00209650 [Conger conger]
MTCPPGSKYDELVKHCIDNTDGKPQQSTELPPVPSLHSPVVSPSVWIPVVVVVNGSILALFLWFIICRRQLRHAHTAADAEAEISPGVQQAGRTEDREGPLDSCPHLNGGPKGLLKQEVPDWRDAFECDAGGGDGGSVHMCNGRKEHGIPLPATELGDAALVTAKTAQYTD